MKIEIDIKELNPKFKIHDTVWSMCYDYEYKKEIAMDSIVLDYEFRAVIKNYNELTKLAELDIIVDYVISGFRDAKTMPELFLFATKEECEKEML